MTTPSRDIRAPLAATCLTVVALIGATSGTPAAAHNAPAGEAHSQCTSDCDSEPDGSNPDSGGRGGGIGWPPITIPPVPPIDVPWPPPQPQWPPVVPPPPVQPPPVEPPPIQPPPVEPPAGKPPPEPPPPEPPTDHEVKPPVTLPDPSSRRSDGSGIPSSSIGTTPAPTQHDESTPDPGRPDTGSPGPDAVAPESPTSTPPVTADVEPLAVVTDFGSWLLLAAVLAASLGAIRVARIVRRYRARRDQADRIETRLETSPDVVDIPAGDLQTHSVRIELRTH